MITVSDVSLNFSGRLLYDDVNLKFTPGNCYGVIGANGAGKSTFLKLLEGKLTPTTGTITTGPNERISSLNQNHFGFEEFEVLETVIQGHKKLYDIMKEKDALYAKADFTEEDGLKAADLRSAVCRNGRLECGSRCLSIVTISWDPRKHAHPKDE